MVLTIFFLKPIFHQQFLPLNKLLNQTMTMNVSDQAHDGNNDVPTFKTIYDRITFRQSRIEFIIKRLTKVELCSGTFIILFCS